MFLVEVNQIDHVIQHRHVCSVSMPVHVYRCILFKRDSVQSSSNYLQKLFTKNLLTAR